jgi:hypothetical protein
MTDDNLKNRLQQILDEDPRVQCGDKEKVRQIIEEVGKQIDTHQQSIVGRVEHYLCLINIFLLIGIPLFPVVVIFAPRSIRAYHETPQRLQFICDLILGYGGIVAIGFSFASCIFGIISKAPLLVVVSLGAVASTFTVRYLINAGVFDWVLAYAS